MKLTRRRRIIVGFTATAAAIGLALTGCSTGSVAGSDQSGSSSAASDAFPVTVKSVFGDTVIQKQPQRVATVSWVNDDVVMGLGIVPVGMPKVEWGGDDQGLTPWKQEALSKLNAAPGTANTPVLYSEADGINFTEIAKTSPDVIIASYSGLTREDFDKLGKIAPVVAYNDAAYGTPWQDVTRQIGTALGKKDQADKLVADTEQNLADKAAQYPQIKDKTFIAGSYQASPSGLNLFTGTDNRPRLMAELGMKMAPVAEAATKDSKEFFVPWSAERSNELVSDIFVAWADSPSDAEAMRTDPLLSQIPATKAGALVVETDRTVTLSFSAISPLGLSWGIDKILPKIAAAADASAKK